MIDFIKLFFLGLLQGLSEFFPISSSGHLTVAQIFLKSETAFLFTVILHFGTLCSLLLFYRKTLFHILKTSTLPFQKNTFFKIITASLPIMSVGLFFYSKIKSFFDHTHTVGLGFIFTGLLLLGTYVSLKKHKLSRLSQYRDLSPTNIQMFNSISYIQALGIGILQSLALFPGVSRSGVSIAAGIYFGLSPYIALHFSFLMSCIALFSACAWELIQTNWTGIPIWPLFIGLMSSFSFGYLALCLMQSWIGHLYRFSFYLLPLGLVVLRYNFF